MKYLFFAAVIILFTGLMYGQTVPQAFNYQGIAVDASGNALSNTTIGLRFSILENASSPVIAYQETQTTTTTSIGQFSIDVGFGSTTNGNFSLLDWSNSYLLQVEMDANGGNNYSFSSTTELLSVPYAFVVAKSGNNPVGREGIAGPDGAQGISGPAGPQGPQGPQGPNSGQGAIGPRGNQGPPGPIGPPGPQGLPGGTQGPPGDQGPIGIDGTADGPAGPQGVQGLTGPQGPQGIPGPVGPTGIAGTERGPQGPPGAPSNEVGPKGPDGPPGPGGGPQGPPGLPGVNCWDTNGNGIADAAEDTNGDGQVTAADCQGQDGVRGPQGPQGPQGAPGAPGQPGLQPAFTMTSVEPINPVVNSIYLDNGSNRSNGTPGFRLWDGSNWIDL